MFEYTLGGIQKIATQVQEPWYIEYFWNILAIGVAPLVAIKITQWIKTTIKRCYGYKPHWLVLDVSAFSICVFAAGTCWYQKFPVWDEVIIIGIIIAVMQTTIIKSIFLLADRFNPELAKELSEGIDDDDHTVTGNIKRAVLGKKNDKT